MSYARTQKLVLSVLVVIITGFLAAPLVPPAVHAQLIGKVCVVLAPSSSCPSSPPVIPGSVGSKFVVAVNIEGSDPLNGFRIFVKTDNTILNPVSADLNNTLLGATILTLANCVNGAGRGCSLSSGDGPGVVDMGVVSLAGLTLPPTTGGLFEITYRVVSPTTSTPLGYPTGCAGSSVSGTTLCVTITNGCACVTPETTQEATFTTSPVFSLSASPESFSLSRGSSTMSTITVASLSGFFGSVALSASVSPSVHHGPTVSPSTATLTLTSGGSATATLAISLRRSAPVGIYSIAVTVAIGTQSVSVLMPLSVTK